MLDGLLNLSFWGYLIAVLIMTHITVVGITLYLHREQCHRGIDLHPIVQHFFRFWLWLTTGIVTKQWVAVHRKHHARCETEEDPHSPVVLGIKKVLWQGAELYQLEARKPETCEKYGRGTPEDWIERNLYSKYSAVGVMLMFALDLALFGLAGIAVWGVQMLWSPFWAAGVINGIGHYWGYRNFECMDAARNIVPIGIIAGGEELHNNHHAYGTSAKFSVKWWEFDIGWMYITLLRWCGLAKVRRMAPVIKTIAGKNQLDVETLKTIISNRFQVMTHYSKTVIAPVFSAERRNATGALRNLYRAQTKRLLMRERSLLDASGHKKIALTLEASKTLQQVYSYQEKLQAIWSKTTATQKELLEALHHWCQQAEATGIEALKTFADRLRSYAPAI